MIRIIIVNWKGYSDTLECLESIMVANLPQKTVIIIADNESNREKTKETINELIKKTNTHCEIAKQDNVVIVKINALELHWICIPTNTGYSKANNIGIRYSDKFNNLSFKYTWILNNDTTVEKNALYYLIKEMESSRNNKICGSVLLYYDDKEIIQSTGVKYNKYMARGLNINNGKNYLSIKDMICDANPDFAVGASMLIENNFFSRVDYFSEDYFLYFEEIDLSQKMLPSEKISICKESLVYHKEGASIGTNSRKQSSPTSIYHYTISSLIFTKKHFKYILIPLLVIYTAKLIVSISQKNNHKARGLYLALKDFFSGERKIGRI